MDDEAGSDVAGVFVKESETSASEQGTSEAVMELDYIRADGAEIDKKEKQAEENTAVEEQQKITSNDVAAVTEEDSDKDKTPASHTVAVSVDMEADAVTDSKADGSADKVQTEESDCKPAERSTDNPDQPEPTVNNTADEPMLPASGVDAVDTPATDSGGGSTPVSGSASGTATPTTQKRTRITNSKLMLKSLPQGVGAEALFEYKWPPYDDHAEYYMLQEQVSVYLDVKSFRRKYPDLERRQIDIEERNYLKDVGAVTEMQCDLGLTALRSDDISDLMTQDYPEKYEEYAKVLQKREEDRLAKKHQDLIEQKNVPQQAPINKSDIKRLTQKAIKAAATYNSFLMREKREARQHYYDIQTGVVQYPKNKKRALPPELTRPSPYPVTVLRGQYSSYYRHYTSDELKYLPLKAVVYNPPLRIHNPYMPLPPDQPEIDQIASHQHHHQHQPTEGALLPVSLSEIPRTDTPPTNRKSSADPAPAPPPPPKHVTKLVDSMCAICFKQPNRLGEEEKCLKCNSCGREAHASCSEVTPMLAVILTYEWVCMECKTCVECSDPGQEEDMIVCDFCDRGFHTFCVGLEEVPDGKWGCPKCQPASS